MFRDGIGYLLATANGDDKVRQFALHRLIQTEPLATASRRPFDFDLDSYPYKESQFGYPVSTKNIHLKALFAEDAAFHLSERPLSKDQRLRHRKDGRVLVEATVRDTQELRWWLLGFGDGVEVIAPAHLRKEFVERVEMMKRLYGRRGSRFVRRRL